jgi:hypothetical protein
VEIVAAGRPDNRVRGVVPADGTFLPVIGICVRGEVGESKWVREKEGGRAGR